MTRIGHAAVLLVGSMLLGMVLAMAWHGYRAAGWLLLLDGLPFCG